MTDLRGRSVNNSRSSSFGQSDIRAIGGDEQDGNQRGSQMASDL